MATFDTRVLITQCDRNGAFEKRFLHLRHPVSGEKVCYMVAADGSIQELHWSKQANTSWFIGEFLSADGSLYLATPVDPLFIVLPILEQLRMKKGDDMGKLRSLDDIVSVEGYPGYVCLLPYLRRALELISESREVGDDKYYRLDDSKVAAWLVCKVMRLAEALKSSSDSFQGQHINDLNIYAVKMLGEYVKMDSWISAICKHLGVDMDALKTVAVPSNMPAPPRPQDNKGNKQNGPAPKKMATSKNNKPAAGCQKITGFFAKPR